MTRPSDTTERAGKSGKSPGAPVAPRDEGSADEAAAKIERGGPKGPEPTRYGDWERNGRCIDF